MNEELESFYRLIKLKPHLKCNENNILTISLQRLLKGTPVRKTNTRNYKTSYLLNSIQKCKLGG